MGQVNCALYGNILHGESRKIASDVPLPAAVVEFDHFAILSAVWIGASDDENSIMTYASERPRLGVPLSFPLESRVPRPLGPRNAEFRGEDGARRLGQSEQPLAQVDFGRDRRHAEAGTGPGGHVLSPPAPREGQAQAAGGRGAEAVLRSVLDDEEGLDLPGVAPATR